MKRTLQISATVMIMFVFLLVATTCGERGADGELPVGVILPLTGDVATYGQAVREGLELALPASDKEDGLELLYEDSRADRRSAINALEKLLARGTSFFIGDATSSVTYEIGPRIQAANGLLLVPIATGDRIREIGQNVFMISPRNEKQTHLIARHIHSQYAGKQVGCLFKQNDYGVNIANTFLGLFEGETQSAAYQEGQTDFRTILSKLRGDGVEVLFVPGNYEETASILRQAREIGYSPVFIGTDGAYSPKLIDLAREASEGFFLAMMPVDYDSEMYRGFEKLYEDRYGKRPDIFASYGYETGSILKSAVAGEGERSVEAVRQRLASSEFDSLTGPLRFSTGEREDWPAWEAERDYQVYVVRGGNFVPAD